MVSVIDVGREQTYRAVESPSLGREDRLTFAAIYESEYFVVNVEKHTGRSLGRRQRGHALCDSLGIGPDR